MIKLFVHDFHFNYFKIEKRTDEDFCCSLNIYYNFSQAPPDNSLNDLEFFNITVATPYGLYSYLSSCIEQGIYSKSFFFPHVLFFEKPNEDEIIKVVKMDLQSLNGKTENELTLKALRRFGWENDNNSDAYEKLFREPSIDE